MIGVHPAVDKEDIVREKKNLAKRSPFTLKRDLLKEHQGDIEQAKDAPPDQCDMPQRTRRIISP